MLRIARFSYKVLIFSHVIQSRLSIHINENVVKVTIQ